MPNGKPIRSDLEVLTVFAECEPFGPIERFTALGITEKQLWTLMRKQRYDKWIDYTWNPNNGHLTELGKIELQRLKQK